jgi:hypothetical protein
MAVTFHRKTLESILIDVSFASRTRGGTESLPMGTREILEEVGEFFLGVGSYYKMPMIGHECIGQNRQNVQTQGLEDQLFKIRVGSIGNKETLAQSAAIEHMVDVTRLKVPLASTHEEAPLIKLTCASRLYYTFDHISRQRDVLRIARPELRR